MTQQGELESFYRAMRIGFRKPEFDPMDLQNPFPNNEVFIHILQGGEVRLVPVKLQQYITDELPWIHYHELPGAGHPFLNAEGIGEVILKKLLIGEK